MSSSSEETDVIDGLPFSRASGDCICSVCGKAYYEHPMYWGVLDYNQEPFLTELCSKDLVKL